MTEAASEVIVLVMFLLAMGAGGTPASSLDWRYAAEDWNRLRVQTHCQDRVAAKLPGEAIGKPEVQELLRCAMRTR